MRNRIAQDILIALEKKATDNDKFFMAEVKNGASGGNFLRMDAVAIEKAWTHPCVEVFEIKSCRQDFMADTKWSSYMNYSNRFSFVCPVDVIKKDELPKEVGLIYYNPETKVLRTVRKALYRNTDIPADFFRYIIFYRLRSDRYPFHDSAAEYWQEWLAEKNHKRTVGHNVRTGLAKKYDDLLQKYDKLASGRSSELEKEYQKLVGVLRKHGIYTWDKENLAEEVDKKLTARDETAFKNKIQAVQDAFNELKKVSNCW